MLDLADTRTVPGSPSRRREDASGPGDAVATKRALLGVSRSLESLAARTATSGAPLAVLSLFEDAEYFAFERERYAELATRAQVVVGFVGLPPALPPGVELITLPDDHVLAGEWTVLVVSPFGSGGLVASDLGRVVEESSLERGRLFDPEMSTDPRWVGEQVERIVAAAGDLLDPAIAAELRCRVDAAAGRGTELPERILRDELLAGWWRSMAGVSRLDRAEVLAYTDPLTGAYNRRFLDRYLGRLGPRAPTLAAIAIDLDGFKLVNDRFGHSTGDAVLRLFADIVRDRIRATDLLVRLGGDEWLVLLPDVTVDQARQRAASILAAFAGSVLPPPAEAAVLRASAGVAVGTAAALDLDVVDAAMYAAKRQGGSQVVVADPVPA